MNPVARSAVLALSLGLALLLSGCALGSSVSDADGSDNAINAFPANYKPDLLGAMHAYLNDPSGVRDAGISEPLLESVGGSKRYVVCLRFNAKKNPREYAGLKEVAAVFIAGRFDRFVETKAGDHDECSGAAYGPFPALEKLAR